jgi:hypothetical protein
MFGGEFFKMNWIRYIACIVFLFLSIATLPSVLNILRGFVSGRVEHPMYFFLKLTIYVGYVVVFAILAKKLYNSAKKNRC